MAVCAPESVTVCAAAMGENSSPPPKAKDAANADNETPEYNAQICGDRLPTWPFHFVSRPPRNTKLAGNDAPPESLPLNSALL